MKVDISKIALVVVMIAGIQTSVLYHRVNDLECQRDIYKSRYEDWEGVSKEIAEYADTLRDSLKARDRLDGKLLVEDAGDFLCTAYCTEKREHICGTELKPVSGEGERGGTVTVGCVEQNFGYTSDTQFQRCLFFRGHFLVSHLAYNFVKSCRKL